MRFKRKTMKAPDYFVEYMSKAEAIKQEVRSRVPGLMDRSHFKSFELWKQIDEETKTYINVQSRLGQAYSELAWALWVAEAPEERTAEPFRYNDKTKRIETYAFKDHAKKEITRVVNDLVEALGLD